MDSGIGEEEAGGSLPGLGSRLFGADDDTAAATLFLGAVVALVILGGVLYKAVLGGKKTNTAEEGLMWTDDDAHAFSPPNERAEFIAAKRGIDPSDPESTRKLKQALMKRSFQAIPLLLELQVQGPSADKLYKKGMITDAMMDRYKHMKAFFDVEFPEVQVEADALVPGWGQSIWQQANQIYQGRKQQQEKEKLAGTSADQDESFVASFNPEVTSTATAPTPQQPMTAEEKEKLAAKMAERLEKEEAAKAARASKSKK